jgi:hypothetical protein
MSSMSWKEWTWPDNEPISSREETSSYWLWVVQLTLQHQFTDVEPERSEQIWRDSWEASNLHFSLSCTQIADSTSARHCYSVIYTSGICWLCWCFQVWSRMSLCMKSMIMSLTIMRRTLHTALYNLSDKKLQVLQKLFEWCLSEGLNSAFC